LTADFDILRARHPDLGFALYALEPGGDVILEIHTPGDGLFTFQAKTMALLMREAFPQEQEQEQEQTPSAALVDSDDFNDLFG
jgi:hypothetical protein